MGLELPTVQDLFDETCYWEEGVWPVKKKDEIKAALFEDLKKRIWLLLNLKAGYIDVAAIYGLTQWSGGTDQPTHIPYNLSNWQGSWTFAGTRYPGEIIVYFEDITGVADMYVNTLALTAESIVAHPPVNSSGQLDSFWRLYPNPNKYHDFDYNAGRPSIGAANRWIIRHHPASPPNLCDFPAYTCREESHRWYPRQTDFLRQLYPLKQGGTITNRISKVEIKAEHITKHSVTHWERNIDWDPFDKCIKGRRLNEHVLEAGEPYRINTPVGQNYVDPLINPAYQDQVVRVCESLVNFVWPADAEWIKNFVHYNAVPWSDNAVWEYGNMVYVSDYNPDGTYPESCFYIAKQGYTATPGDPKKPGTAAGADYWETPAYNPKYIAYNVEFPHCQDVFNDVITTGTFSYDLLSSAEYFDCNGSAFELFLKNHGSYDWYFDTGHPWIPWWIYKNNKGVPSDPPNYPFPRGTWRRTWKHSMGRPGHPESKSEYLLWAGELGDPPGYWSGRDQVYKRLNNRFIITQTQYDNITAGDNKDYYRVVDVETLYAQAVAEKETEHYVGYIDDLLSRHDPVKYIDGIPKYEGLHQLLNDMRYVLVQLRYAYYEFTASLTGYFNSARLVGDPAPPTDLNRATSLGAYTAARERAEKPSNFEVDPVSNGYHAIIGLNGGTTWRGAPHSAWTGALTSLSTRMSRGLLRILLYDGDEDVTDKELPAFPNKGTMLFHVKVRSGFVCTSSGTQILEPCKVGVADKFFDPPCTTAGSAYWWHGFIGGEPISEFWWWTGTKWQYYLDWWIVPAEEWPDDAWFTNKPQATYMWRKGTDVDLVLGAGGTVPGAMEIDLNSYPDDVFKEDKTNYIEV